MRVEGRFWEKSFQVVSLVILLYILLEISYMGLRVFESVGNSVTVQFFHSIMVILILLTCFRLVVLVLFSMYVIK